MKCSIVFRTENVKDVYELQEIIGEGAFGKVIRAIHKETSEQFAIKMIQKKDLDAGDLKNIMNEIRVGSCIEHPNIVKLSEVFESPTAYLIVFELMRGGELFDRICEKQNYTEKEAANSIKPVIDAICFCHKQGVVHRDIKPENLLYMDETDQSIVKVSDFGMAKVLDNRTHLMSTVCGTPAYSAPEVIMNQKYDCTCDIWSLGVVLYVMLCGYPPFDSESNEENLKNVTEGNFSFPSPDWDQVSEQAKDLIRKMINPDPKQRISAEKILKHPWLVENSDTKLQISEKLRRYNARRKLKTAQMVAFVSSLLLQKKDKVKNN